MPTFLKYTLRSEIQNLGLELKCLRSLTRLISQNAKMKSVDHKFFFFLQKIKHKLAFRLQNYLNISIIKETLLVGNLKKQKFLKSSYNNKIGLVCGIEDLWKTWMIHKWLQMSPSDSPDRTGSILCYSESSEVPYSTN